jgi:hypothetical protein
VPSIHPITIQPPRIDPVSTVFDGVAGAPKAEDIDLKFLRDLWQAALGNGSDASTDRSANANPALPASLQTLLAAQLMASDTHFDSGAHSVTYDGPLVLGGNAVYGEAIDGAARRTGLAPALLASIVSAEANSNNGVWDPNSRNPRSSAAGLTQFLASTWEAETERPGTWLNRVASANGWLDGSGRVTPDARRDLLDLRFNPTASIEAAADYARGNLQSLAEDGLVPRGASHDALAKMAYLSHHLGLGDAARYLRGGIPEERARVLLTSQIGAEAAQARIAQSGSGAAAHRAWLANYIDTKITPERFIRV